MTHGNAQIDTLQINAGMPLSEYSNDVNSAFSGLSEKEPYYPVRFMLNYIEVK
jgi:hypothetical protein